MPLTPMMQHYLEIKEKHKDAVVLYRLGDFYEMFFDDAIEMSKVLDITLTGRDCGLEQRAPMCGVPYHSVDTYIAKLLKEGRKIALCEQLNEAKKGVKVERDVVRVITPGTITEDNMLDELKNNYILCVYKSQKKIGVAYSDISTGEFYTTEYTKNLISNLSDLVVRINPAEIICNNEGRQALEEIPVAKLVTLPKFDIYYNWAFESERAINNLKKQFSNVVLNIYEINDMPEAICACGALLEYLNETQKKSLVHINKIKKIDTAKYMILDIIARRNLELVETIRERKKKGSLLALLDNTRTSMGGRLIRNWLDQPLKDSKEINARLSAVEELCGNLILRDSLKDELSKVSDIERLTSRIGLSLITPRECIKLKKSLSVIPNIKKLLNGTTSQKLNNFHSDIKDFNQIFTLLDCAIKEQPSQNMRDGDFISDGYNNELDELRLIKNHGVEWIAELEAREQNDTGIKNLKIKFNNVYGYFIEVSKNLCEKIPINYHRKQTVGNNDRYFTEELKLIEEKILSADEKGIKLEYQLFNEVRIILIDFIKDFQEISTIVSELDCLLSLSHLAIKNNYVKPVISDKIKHIKITDGRHPVIENYLKDSQFIANDTFLDQDKNKIMIITGPNMAGKSTYMRQVALITLLAHIGSFVPAKYAEISIVDRIFTRVGASDDLALGQSTFMVEMMEMANILHNATNESLVILDEIGRGTSTFDGLSIAWSMVEYLCKNMKTKALFATHYHELTELEGLLTGIKNYKINVKEINNSIVFLRKIVRGGANKSFGIEVAALAGLPEEIITRAKEISHNIEQNDFNIKLGTQQVEQNEEIQTKVKNNLQVIEIIKDLKIETVTPLEAFEILADLIKKIKQQ
ncbi:MAG: DNA mismatch repair protein MutS [Clostridia bacterium]|nr:DNA mismatch repair protein MutS [Clostridia bacterium]MDD4685684.1 DNA mismatch repair protein MutS [Clostridia bacterium]